MTKKTSKSRSSEHKNDLTQENGRRDFFKKSLLGAGGLAMATGSTLTSCSEPVVQAASDAIERATIQGTNVLEWHTPPQIDLTEDYPIDDVLNELPNLKPFRMDPDVKFKGFPHFLTVDNNGGNSTPGNVSPLYAYNGTVPGPTFRIKGDQDLEVILINNLPGNDGYWAAKQDSRTVKGDNRLASTTKDYQISDHLYGPHQQNITNLHTHGLHVSPGSFPNSTIETSLIVHSDNVLLRVIPVEDYLNRLRDEKEKAQKESRKEKPVLLDNEVVGVARYKFKLPRPDGTPHYAGTHWYHPHPHGATFDQVAGGMAGFLIVEGEIDTFLEKQFKEDSDPDKGIKGYNAFFDLPLMIQRVKAPAPVQGETDGKGEEQKTSQVAAKVNGQLLSGGLPTAMAQPNQIIRLRVLNGSVDGKGYLRLLISKGDTAPALIAPNDRMYKDGKCGNPINASATAKRWFKSEPDTADRLCLNNIAYDGINLIDEDGNYTDMAVEWITIGVANRADLLIHIPDGAKTGETYTIWAQEMNEAVDVDGARDSADNLAIARIEVQESGDPKKKFPRPALNADGSLNIQWPGQIEEMLRPIPLEEITIGDNEETTDAYLPNNPAPTNLDGEPISLNENGNAGKAIRARRILYSGFGHAGVNATAYDPDETVTFGDNTQKDLHTVYNAMLIDGKKYGADTPHGHGWDTAQHKMKLGTAEEWTVYNYSMTSYIKDIKVDNTEASNYIVGLPAYRINSKDDKYKELSSLKNKLKDTCPGKDVACREAKLLAKAVHHPFHMHTNPFYVRSVQDHEGNELLPLDDNGNPIPRWQDTVYIPHNGGRAIFRSRFWDYKGKYVNHCHLLQHEDWGMMQAVEVVDGVETRANYIPLPIQEAEKNNVFPGLSLNQMFRLNLGKVQGVLSEDSLRMLCYNPSTTTFFDQKPIKHLSAVKTEPNYFNLRTFKQKQKINEDNLGYLIEPVPTEQTPYPKWTNNFKSSPQIV